MGLGMSICSGAFTHSPAQAWPHSPAEMERAGPLLLSPSHFPEGNSGHQWPDAGKKSPVPRAARLPHNPIEMLSHFRNSMGKRGKRINQNSDIWHYTRT